MIDKHLRDHGWRYVSDSGEQHFGEVTAIRKRWRDKHRPLDHEPERLRRKLTGIVRNVYRAAGVDVFDDRENEDDDPIGEDLEFERRNAPLRLAGAQSPAS